MTYSFAKDDYISFCFEIHTALLSNLHLIRLSCHLAFLVFSCDAVTAHSQPSLQGICHLGLTCGLHRTQKHSICGERNISVAEYYPHTPYWKMHKRPTKKNQLIIDGCSQSNALTSLSLGFEYFYCIQGSWKLSINSSVCDADRTWSVNHRYN